MRVLPTSLPLRIAARMARAGACAEMWLTETGYANDAWSEIGLVVDPDGTVRLLPEHGEESAVELLDALGCAGARTRHDIGPVAVAMPAYGPPLPRLRAARLPGVAFESSNCTNFLVETEFEAGAPEDGTAAPPRTRSSPTSAHTAACGARSCPWSGSPAPAPPASTAAPGCARRRASPTPHRGATSSPCTAPRVDGPAPAGHRRPTMSRRREYDVAPFLALLQQRAPRPLTIAEMARLLDLERFDPRSVRSLLDAEVDRNRLRRIGRTRYQWRREDEAPRARRSSAGRGAGIRVAGHYTRVRAGYGFVSALGRAADRFPRDILINNGDEGAALHGDRVVVEITGRDPRRQRATGRVVEVTEAVHERIVGALEPGWRGWLLVPDSDLLPPVAIIGGETPGADARGRTGLVRLTRPGAADRAPGGVLERILGDADEPEVQFLSIALEHGLRLDFPEDVEAEAAALPDDPTAPTAGSTCATCRW